MGRGTVKPRANMGTGGPLRCAGCHSNRQAELDADLVAGRPIRELAEKFGISKSAIARHRAHVSTSLVKFEAPVSITNGSVATSDDVATEARRLYDSCRAALDTAIEGGNVLQMSLAAREARGSLELLGRQIDRLEQRRVVAVVDLQRSQEWIEIRTLIMELIRPYPGLGLELSTRLLALDAAESAN